MASPLDTPTSTSDATTHTFTVSAGNQRCLIVGIEQEGTTLGAPTVTYGGQSMTNAVDIEVNPGTTSQRVTLFYLNDAGIVAASSTTISVSNSVAASISIHAASYQDAMQTTPTNTDTDSSTAATPNPLAACDIVTGAADAVVVALSGMGNSGTAAWGGTLTERTDQQANATATGSLADDSVPTATTIACDCTWTTQNRAAICALELEHDAGVGITSIDPTTFDMDNADVDINGSGFEASQGTGDVYLSDANTLAGSANEVDITSAVNTWSDTVVNLDLTQLSAAELADLHTLGPGQRYVILVNDSSDEYGSTAITLHRPTAFVMSLSANFAPTTTTAQLTAPAGKNTGDMDGGRLEEALNPSTTNTTVTADDYREDAWCIEATDGSREVIYAFRVLYSDVVADTITQTPKITVTGGPDPLTAESGSYTWTGTAASLEYGSLVAADAGSYAWTGTAASLEYGSLVTADAGSYSWTGQDATFPLDTVLGADAGSYSWTGQDASLELGALVSAEAGSYAWTGQDASLEFGAAVVAESGSYAWSGQDASLEFGADLVAESGSYNWTGTAASLEFGALVSAESAAYLWTGQDATFPAGLTLSAESGSYAWTGTAASLEHDTFITAESGSYAWTGQDATFPVGLLISAEAGSYSWAGQDASLEFGALLNAEAASYDWTGTATGLLADRLITAESVAYVWTGQDADLIHAAGMTLDAEAGAYIWTGSTAGLNYSGLAGAVRRYGMNRGKGVTYSKGVRDHLYTVGGNAVSIDSEDVE